MSLNRRQFLKNAGIGSAAVIGGASMLKSSSAFAAAAPLPNSDISFIGGNASYASTTGKTGRRGMIYDVLLPLQAAVTAGIQGKNVIIKPNLVYGSGQNAQTTLNCTPVDALRGLIDFLRMINPNLPITIAEASATTTSSMMNWCGYLQLMTDYTNITLVDLTTNKVVTSSGSTGATSNYPAAKKHLWKLTRVASDLVEVSVTSAFLDKANNYVISIARPKSHNCMVMTATVKNMCMGMPLVVSGGLNCKQQMHGDSSWYQGTHTNEDQCLAWNIYQMGNQMKLYGAAPSLAVLDAWEGQEHNGPTSGTSIMQYCAVAGTDFLAVDRMSAKLMGLSDTVIKHQVAPYNTPSYTDARALVWMSNAGLGNYDLSKINLLNGKTLADVTPYIKSYQMNDNYTATNGITTSWETTWADSTNLDQGPGQLLDSVVTGVHGQGSQGPSPYMEPQVNLHTNGVVTGNEVKIDLSLPYANSISLGIYNLHGQEVRRLGSENLRNGRYSIVWDCKDSHGSRVPNGNYIIKLQSRQGQLCDKITLLR